MERYDIAIIGSGAAGVSAAINAKIRKKKAIVFGNKDLSKKITAAPAIHNYPGLPAISGEDLGKQFQDHMDTMGIEITEERINNIYAMGDYYTLMGNSTMYEASTIILATGVNFGKPLEGEDAYLGKGVGYCATCDAPLYRGKTVVIIAYNKHEEAEANFVASIAGKVYYIPMYKDEVEVSDSIEIIRDTPMEVSGDDFVRQLILKKQIIDTDGIFILRESVSPGQLVPGIALDENHIYVNRKMETNLPGCFAAGDIVGTPYQYVKAAGEGNIAALSAVAYLDKLKNKEA